MSRDQKCHTSLMTLSMTFACCPNLMFLASPWLEIYRFSNWSFFWLGAVQSWYSFCERWENHNWPYLFPFTDFGRVTVILLNYWIGHLFHWAWVRHGVKNNPVKIQEARIGSGTSYFQLFNQQKSRTGVCSQ